MILPERPNSGRINFESELKRVLVNQLVSEQNTGLIQILQVHSEQKMLERILLGIWQRMVIHVKNQFIDGMLNCSISTQKKLPKVRIDT